MAGSDEGTKTTTGEKEAQGRIVLFIGRWNSVRNIDSRSQCLDD